MLSCGCKANIQLRLKGWNLWPKMALEAISECIIFMVVAYPSTPSRCMSCTHWICSCCAHITCSSWLRHWGESDMQRHGNSTSINFYAPKSLPVSFALYQCSCFQFHPQSIPLDHNFPKGCQMPYESHSFLWSQYHYWKWKYSWLWKEIQSLSSLFECCLHLPSATEKVEDIIIVFLNFFTCMCKYMYGV